jgi:ectoine hydroxylase-related dioxygenase (phytanoyl-CoA dioxygenase family)
MSSLSTSTASPETAFTAQKDPADKEQFLTSIREQGYAMVPDVLSPEFISRARTELERAIEAEAKYHKTDKYSDYGMVLLCPLYGGAFFEILENPKVIKPMEWVMGEGCIVYSQTSTSMPPHGGNYSSRIHVDCPRIIPGYLSTFASLILLDDFTEENGATWFLPGSHTQAEAPSEEVFYKEAKRLIAPAGTALFWNPRVWHAGGKNNTDQWRHALTIVTVKPYMKQRIDIPRALAGKDLSHVSDKVLQKLGFFAQVPASYDEYYVAPELRKFRQKAE